MSGSPVRTLSSPRPGDGCRPAFDQVGEGQLLLSGFALRRTAATRRLGVAALLVAFAFPQAVVGMGAPAPDDQVSNVSPATSLAGPRPIAQPIDLAGKPSTRLARQSCEGAAEAERDVAPPASVVQPSAKGAPPRVVASTGEIGRCSWIVRLKRGADAEQVARSVKGRPAKVGLGRAVRGFAAHLTTSQVTALRHDRRVESVTPDWLATTSDDQADPPWGLDRIDQTSLPLSDSYTYDPTAGAGVTAYVIDSGIRATHHDFGGRVEAGANFAPGVTGTDDCLGHGTHVSGTIGGATYGVAKAVTLVPVRVFDCGNSTAYSTIIEALDWVIADHAAGEPAVANLSLGGPADLAMNEAIAAVIADGIVVVVAAGNDGQDACGTSPASAANALTVGATDVTDTRASFSNLGPCLDLFAPGVDTLSDDIASDTATAVHSGTSMATPHVTGIAAILFGRYPGANPLTVAAALIDDATPGVVTGAGSSPNRLAHVAPLTPGPQHVYVVLPALYLSEPPVTAEAISTSGQT
jgi:subtilisin family serine protease